MASACSSLHQKTEHQQDQPLLCVRRRKSPKSNNNTRDIGKLGRIIMKWEKLGLIYRPDGNSQWAKHSALQPTPLVLGDKVRVFCGFRDEGGVSRIGYVDLDSQDPQRVKKISAHPVLDTGQDGAFDQDGVVPCAVLRIGEKIYLYYAGYLRGDRARFQAFCGLAISENGGESFKRYSPVPVLDRTAEAPLFRVIHSIISDNGVWRIWYGAGGKFIQGEKKTLPVYNIRYMESANYDDFPKTGTLAIDVANDEYRVGRPYIFVRNDNYYLFFGSGSENKPYQLEYAVSSNGHNWTRCGEIPGLSLSKSGWDSEMMAYPAVISTKGGTYMFYNGNDYGREGFGCARLLSW